MKRLLQSAIIILCILTVGCKNPYMLESSYDLVNLVNTSDKISGGNISGGMIAGVGAVGGSVSTEYSRRYLFYAKNRKTNDIMFFNIDAEEETLIGEKLVVFRYTENLPYMEIHRPGRVRKDGHIYYNNPPPKYIIYINEGQLDKYIEISLERFK